MNQGDLMKIIDISKNSTENEIIGSCKKCGVDITRKNMTPWVTRDTRKLCGKCHPSPEMYGPPYSHPFWGRVNSRGAWHDGPICYRWSYNSKR